MSQVSDNRWAREVVEWYQSERQEKTDRKTSRTDRRTKLSDDTDQGREK